MKRIIYTSLFMLLCLVAYSQDKTKIMEQRAKDFHAALNSNDRAVWKKFINENYTSRLINARGIENLLEMWAQVHADFGDSRMVSSKWATDKQEMIIARNDDGQKVSFLLIPEVAAPYKIDKLAIEAGDIQGGPGGGKHVVVKDGPGPGGPEETLMNELLDVMRKGDATQIDTYLKKNSIATLNREQLKAEIIKQGKATKDYQVTTIDVNDNSVKYILKPETSNKFLKIAMSLDKAGKIENLTFTDK